MFTKWDDEFVALCFAKGGFHLQTPTSDYKHFICHSCLGHHYNQHPNEYSAILS